MNDRETIGSVTFSPEEVSDTFHDAERAFPTRMESIQDRITRAEAGEREGYEYEVKRFKGDLEFLRPPREEDIAYRLRVEKDLTRELQGALKGSSDNLRFHATSICAARDIISSGTISSAVDHAGTQASYDSEGFFSVTTPDTVGTSINEYLDIESERFCVPMGCLFILHPRDAADAKLGESLKMRNADLHVQLTGILVSPEMLSRVREWLGESGFDPGLAIECFTYVDELKQSSKRAA